MIPPQDDLVTLFDLEILEEDLFRGQSRDIGLPQLFGGQALGQAAAAATQSVASDRQLHSLHGYFLRPGDPNLAVDYRVERVRDGGSFATRRVSAIQKDTTLFFCSASFHGEEASLEHQPTPPPIPTPETLLAQGASIERRLHNHPMEIIVADERHEPTPTRSIWFRLGDGGLPQSPALHRSLLCYSSDFSLLPTALLGHGIEPGDSRLHLASLDHAVWIHESPKLDDWLLYVTESPWAANARGFSRGSFYDRAGRLIASSAQEGLIRVKS